MVKLLACLFMLIDHIGVYLYPFLPEELAIFCRIVGRLAFPMFAWQVALGYARTRNPLVYFGRMTLFAVLSEIIIRQSHAWADFYWPGTNIMVTFALAIVLITGLRLITQSSLDMVAGLRPVSSQILKGKDRFDVRFNPGGLSLDPRLGLILGLLVIAMTVTAALWLRPDYGLYGLFTVGLFYLLQTFAPAEDLYQRSLQLFLALNGLFLIVHVFADQMPFDWAMVQVFAVFAIPLIAKIGRDRKPSRWLKYGFYVFYPTHLAGLVILNHFLLALGV